MIVLIAHRGNTNGPDPARENDPAYVGETLEQGYDAEIDVWYRDGAFSLGHDAPQYAVPEQFLENSKLWCHAKNVAALERMLENGNIHCFWHQGDDCALTSRGIIWTYPGKALTKKSVCVMPELHGIENRRDLPDCFGICSDYVCRFTPAPRP